MDLFKNNFSDKNMYIMKKNVQRKEGLQLTNNLQEIINNNDKNLSSSKIYEKYIYDK